MAEKRIKKKRDAEQERKNNNDKIEDKRIERENVKEIGEQENKPKKSKITEISQNPLYIIFTLILGLFGAVGGIPGIIQFRDYLNEEPKFVFTSDFISRGILGSGDTTSIFLSGAVSNTGEKPLFVKGFQLKISINGNDYKTNPAVIHDGLGLVGESKTLLIEKGSEQDLQRIKKILPSEPVNGSLWFVTTFSLDTLRKYDKQVV